MSKYCENCGAELTEGADICLKCGKMINNKKSNNQNNKSGKSKIAAGILGILLGTFGVHNFYLGYKNKAIAQVLITVLSCFTLSFISAIWGLIEGIMILTGSINVDSDGTPLVD